MTTASVELTPFDLQVLSLAQLHRSKLSWSQQQLVVPEIGTFTRLPDGCMQLLGTGETTKWARILSPEGGRQLGALHYELLTQPLDIAARDSAAQPASSVASSLQQLQQAFGSMTPAAVHKLQQAGVPQAVLDRYTYEMQMRGLRGEIAAHDRFENINALGKLTGL